ncbi:MAG: FtsQ-type POTRA domain-containing protein [Verrucomicrobia bacterium]|nr:FtsQ-type POTRA domain-containing protein [Verrucomicrobiota bacterium]
MIKLFTSNKRRRRTSTGNYAFRRKKPARTEIHRLDMNPETVATRRATLRKRAGVGARWAFGLLSAIVFLALMKVVVMEAFVSNRDFHIQNINIVTKGPLTQTEITAASGLKLGDNLLMVSLRAVHDRLDTLPEVRTVTVTRQFPGTILVEVQQRTPVAWLECPDKAIAARVPGYGCLLDDQGIVLPNANQEAADQKLPVISVDKLPRIVPGKHVESPAALAALKLQQLYENSPLNELHHLTKIDATRAHALVVRFDSGLTATFPADGNPVTELHRLQRTLDAASQRNMRVATVNLLVEHNVPVTLQSSTATITPSNSRRTIAAVR